MNTGEEKKKNRGGLREFLSVKTELPSDLLCGGFRLEVRGRNQIFLTGCRRILKYSSEEMIMSVKGFSVSVRGERLVCSTYHAGNISIDGFVKSVNFIDASDAEDY